MSYHDARYLIVHVSYRFYDNENDLVKASNVCYIERALCEKWASAG